MTLSHYEYIKAEKSLVVNIQFKNSDNRVMQSRKAPLSDAREKGLYIVEMDPGSGPVRSVRLNQKRATFSGDPLFFTYSADPEAALLLPSMDCRAR
jgi:hypothetical protein